MSDFIWRTDEARCETTRIILESDVASFRAQLNVGWVPNNVELRAMIQHDVCDCLRALLETGYDPDYGHPPGADPVDRSRSPTLLERALVAKCEENCLLLLGRGADPHKLDSQGRKRNMLHFSGWSLPVTKRLIELGVNANQRSIKGETSLMFAVHQGNPEVMRALIAAGADLNASIREMECAPEFKTCLSEAVSAMRVEMIPVLLELGASTMVTDGCGKALNPVMDSLLSDARAAPNSLEKFEATLNYLIGAGLHVNMPDQHGSTPLIRAGDYVFTDYITPLLARGADVNAADDDGESALHTAVRKGASRNVALLLAAGADPKLCNRDGNSPLMLAENDCLAAIRAWEAGQVMHSIAASVAKGAP